jgi:uncharacterized protein (DUF608 family)
VSYLDICFFYLQVNSVDMQFLQEFINITQFIRTNSSSTSKTKIKKRCSKAYYQLSSRDDSYAPTNIDRILLDFLLVYVSVDQKIPIRRGNLNLIHQNVYTLHFTQGDSCSFSVLDTFTTCLFTTRSWSEYDLTEFGVKLVCRQISPFIPHDYKNSSLPSAVFVWEVENVCGEERQVSITFIMKNGTGSKKDSDGNPQTDCFEQENFEGAKIIQTIAGLPCTYFVAVAKSEDKTSSKLSKIDPSGNGSLLWNDLLENGMLTEKSECKNLRDGKDVCIGVSSKMILKPSQTKEVEIAFVWDAPRVKFPKSDRIYSKFYTQYFDNGLKIVEHSLNTYSEWERAIATWQKEVLEDS